MESQKTFLIFFKQICIFVLVILIVLLFGNVAESKNEQSKNTSQNENGNEEIENISQNTEDTVDTRNTAESTELGNGYQITTECYKVVDEDLDYNIIIEYPRISGIDNESIENIINARLKAKAFTDLLDWTNLQNAEFRVTYDIEYVLGDFISIKYTSEYFHKAMAYPHIDIYTLNMMLNEDYLISLNDLIKIDEEFVNNFFENFELQNSNGVYDEWTVNSFNKDTKEYDLSGDIWDVGQYFRDKWYISDNKIVFVFYNAGGGMDHIFYESKNIDANELIKNLQIER